MTTEIDRLHAAAAAGDFATIIDSLQGGPGYFPETALRVCQEYREQVTPLLIQSIKWATAREEAGKDQSGDDAVFALQLLWEFQCQAALPAILATVALPDEGPFTVLGEDALQDLPRVLAALVGDDLEPLWGLIANPAVNSFIRWSAVDGFRYLVRDGRVTRAAVSERLREQLRVELADPDQLVVTSLACFLCDMNAREALPEIEIAIAEGLVERGECRLDKMLAAGEEHCAAEIARLEPTQLADAVERMRDWSWFEERPDFGRFSDYGDDYDEVATDEDEPATNYQPMPYEPSTTIRNESPRIGRNDPCPCGSGLKYKKCCLRKEPLI